MKLRDIGEFGFIEKVSGRIRVDGSVVRGIGDDTAVIEWKRDKFLLVTTDMLIEDVHFRRADSPADVGWKAMCCGVSDIAAMGGEPRWAVVSCGFPKNLNFKYVEKIYTGLKKASRRFGVNIIGGDTNSSEKIICDVTMLGEAKKKELVLRSGAKVGDFIFVTGTLGGSLRGRHLKFMPRLKEAKRLVKNFKINAMIDLSDGLASDLNHCVRQSKAGAFIYEDLIPKASGIKDCDRALTDGEDFELLFTMSKEEGYKLLDVRGNFFDIPITRIGSITNKGSGVRIVNKAGKIRELKLKGFRHF